MCVWGGRRGIEGVQGCVKVCVRGRGVRVCMCVHACVCVCWGGPSLWGCERDSVGGGGVREWGEGRCFFCFVCFFFGG